MAKLKEIRLDERIEEFLGLKGKSTARVYRAGLKLFLEYYREKHGEEADFDDFLDLIFEEFKKGPREQRRVAEPEIAGFIEYMTEKELANKSMLAYLAGVQNYLKYRNVTVSMTFIGNVPQNIALKVNEKHEWKLEQIQEFLDRAKTFRDKALILCIVQSGLGLEELLSLSYGDIQNEFEKGIVPIHMRLTRQKSGVLFRTFFGRDAVKYLRLYLETRQNLTSDSPLFTKWGSDVTRLTKEAVDGKFREIADSVDFITEEDMNGYNPARPHSLRAAFRSRLTGKVADSLIEFWMGHEIGEQKRAYLNLPTEEMRELYMDAEKHLALEKTSRDELIEKEKKVTIPPEALAEIEDLKGTIHGLYRQYDEARNENLELKSRMARTELTVTKLEKHIESLESTVKRIRETLEKAAA